MSANGLITTASTFGVDETVDRFEAGATAKGLTIFAKIDHAAGAKDAGLDLRPTTLLIFGHAKGGTPLMQLGQTIGIDLPLKVLVWEDDAGKTWLSYNDPAWIAARHGLAQSGAGVASAMALQLEALANQATGASSAPGV
jgi:uncharacterized protein (DUF302 family)